MWQTSFIMDIVPEMWTYVLCLRCDGIHVVDTISVYLYIHVQWTLSGGGLIFRACRASGFVLDFGA